MEIKQTILENNNNALKSENEREPIKKIFVICKIKRVNNWTDEEDEILMQTAEKFDFKNWNAIADHLPGRSAIQCSARYKRIQPGIVKGSWTVREDQHLMNLLRKFGKNWSLISKYMSSRSGKQIRDRYLNALDPNLSKDKFTPQEDEKILKLYAEIGSQWSRIAQDLPGRTGDMIKNRFYSSLRKQIHSDDYREGLRKKKIILSEQVKGDTSPLSKIEEKSNQFGSRFSKQKKFLLKKKKRLSLCNIIKEEAQAKENISAKINSVKFEVIREHSSMSSSSMKVNNSDPNENSKTDNLLFENFHNNFTKYQFNRNSNYNFHASNLNPIKNELILNNSGMIDEMNQSKQQNTSQENLNTAHNMDLNTLNTILQQTIVSNFMLMKQEHNILNYNLIDYQMMQLMNVLLQQNFNANAGTRTELEAQLTLLRQILNFTFMKLEYCKRGDATFDSRTNSLNLQQGQSE